MDKTEFSIPVRVYIEDTDAGGIVFYVNYLKYMERARTELFRSIGFPKPAIISEGLLLVVASASIEYRKSARLDQQLNVTAKIVKLARTYVTFEQSVLDESNTILCSAVIKIACVTQNELKPCLLPDIVRAAVQRLI